MSSKIDAVGTTIETAVPGSELEVWRATRSNSPSANRPRCSSLSPHSPGAARTRAVAHRRRAEPQIRWDIYCPFLALTALDATKHD